MTNNVYEFHLNNGDIILADVVETSGEQFVVFDPLQMVQEGKTWLLQKYFQTSTDRWLPLHDSVITTMAKTSDEYVTNYFNVCAKLYGPPEDKYEEYLETIDPTEIH